MTTTVEPTAPEQRRTVVRQEPARSTARPTTSWAGAQLVLARTLLVLGFVVVWVLAYLTFLSGFEANHAQSRLYSELRTQLALGLAPVGAPIATGAPVAVVSVPRAGIKNLVVVEGTSGRQLQDAPGHLRGTVLPGQQGTSALLGRSLSYGGPFGKLGKLHVGDPIQVTTGQGSFTYRVTGARRSGDPLPASPPVGEGRLVLVTALGSGPLAKLSPSDTVYLDATLGSKAVAPGARSAAVADEAPMKASFGVGTLALLALALQLLALVLVATSWARVRWSPLAAWIVGVPMVVGALWAVSSLATQLLPNLV